MYVSLNFDELGDSEYAASVHRISQHGPALSITLKPTRVMLETRTMIAVRAIGVNMKLGASTRRSLQSTHMVAMPLSSSQLPHCCSG